MALFRKKARNFLKGFLFFLLSKSRHDFIYPFVDASCTVNGKQFYANQKRSGSTPGWGLFSHFFFLFLATTTAAADVATTAAAEAIMAAVFHAVPPFF